MKDNLTQVHFNKRTRLTCTCAFVQAIKSHVDMAKSTQYT